MGMDRGRGERWQGVVASCGAAVQVARMGFAGWSRVQSSKSSALPHVEAPSCCFHQPRRRKLGIEQNETAAASGVSCAPMQLPHSVPQGSRLQLPGSFSQGCPVLLCSFQLLCSFHSPERKAGVQAPVRLQEHVKQRSRQPCIPYCAQQVVLLLSDLPGGYGWGAGGREGCRVGWVRGLPPARDGRTKV